MIKSFEKATQSFDSLNFYNRIQAIGQLLKNTITIIGRDRDIIKPWIRMLIYHFVMVGCFFYAIYSILISLPFAWVAWIIAPLMFLYKHFYNNKQEIRLSWTVNETLVGRDPSYKEAVKSQKKVKSQTRKIAWMDIAMAMIDKTRNTGEGMAETIISLVVSGLEEVWDLANHYLLPSVAVDSLDIKPALEKMKRLKDEVPKALVGVFGIDFIGNVVGRIIVPFYVFGLAIIIGLAMYFTNWGPYTAQSQMIQHYAMIAAVAVWFMGKLGHNILERSVECIKVIYFTIFYDQITHPDDIAPDLRPGLVDYLKLKNVDVVDDLDKQTAVNAEAAKEESGFDVAAT